MSHVLDFRQWYRLNENKTPFKMDPDGLTVIPQVDGKDVEWSSASVAIGLSELVLDKLKPLTLFEGPSRFDAIYFAPGPFRSSDQATWNSQAGMKFDGANLIGLNFTNVVGMRLNTVSRNRYVILGNSITGMFGLGKTGAFSIVETEVVPALNILGQFDQKHSPTKMTMTPVASYKDVVLACAKMAQAPGSAVGTDFNNANWTRAKEFFTILTYCVQNGKVSDMPAEYDANKLVKEANEIYSNLPSQRP